MVFGFGKGQRNKDKRNQQNNKTAKSIAKKRGKTPRNAFGRKSRANALANGSVNKLFHGVAVRPRDDSCCAAVTSLDGQRFLSEEAPLLPLAECSDPTKCRCVYEHFDERRDNLRRESDVGLPVRAYPDEKRLGHGRRITDG